MTFGPLAKSIARAAVERGHAVPADAIAPPIPVECAFAYAAFSELTTTRPSGFDLGRIPWTAIRDYAATYGVRSVDQFDEFVFFVRVIDNAYLEQTRKR